MPSLEVRSPSQVVRTYTIKWNVELPPNGICGASGMIVRRERTGGASRGGVAGEGRPEFSPADHASGGFGVVGVMHAV